MRRIDLVPKRAAAKSAALLWTFLVAAGGGALSAQEEGAIAFETDPSPQLYVTDFAWYRTNRREDGRVDPNSLACAQALPRRAFGELTGTDYLSSDGYYGEKYKRFKSFGIDGIAFLVTDRLPDSFDGANLIQLADLAVAADLDFFAYYDFFVNTVKTSKLVLCPGGQCGLPPGHRRVPAFNLASMPQIYDQLREDFEDIARYLIQPHMDAGGAGYRMLEDVNGERVLDEEGLPRPVIALTIAREISDGSGSLRRAGELMAELTEAFRALGIGKPALVLDVIFWATPRAPELEDPYDPDVLEAFGEYAVAITWYGFFDPYRGGKMGITNDGPRPPVAVWGRQLHNRYLETRDALVADGLELMIWPGGQAQFDTRDVEVQGCRKRNLDIVYHLRSAEDWRVMLDRVLRNGWRPSNTGTTPLQTVALINNAGEWYELGGIDLTTTDRFGQCSFPFHWCDQLLQVIREEDRY